MSYKVTHLVRSRKAGSPTRKVILMVLADVANHDGSSVYISTKTIADESEVSQRTVKRQLKAMEYDGLIVRVGKKPCMGGFTVIYNMDLNVISALEKSGDKLSNEACEVVTRETGVVTEGAKKDASSVTQTILEQSNINNNSEPSAEELCFKEIWEAYNHRLPKSRQGGKDKAFQSFKRQAKAHGMENVVRGLHSYYTDPQQSKSKYEFASGIGVAIRQEKFIGYISASNESKKLYRNMEQARVYAVALAKGRWENQWGAPDDIVKKLASKLQEHSA